MSVQLYDLARIYQDETLAYAESQRAAHAAASPVAGSAEWVVALRTRAARALVLAGALLSANHSDRVLLRATVTAAHGTTNGTTTKRG